MGRSSEFSGGMPSVSMAEIGAEKDPRTEEANEKIGQAALSAASAAMKLEITTDGGEKHVLDTSRLDRETLSKLLDAVDNGPAAQEAAPTQNAGNEVSKKIKIEPSAAFKQEMAGVNNSTMPSLEMESVGSASSNAKEVMPSLETPVESAANLYQGRYPGESEQDAAARKKGIENASSVFEAMLKNPPLAGESVSDYLDRVKFGFSAPKEAETSVPKPVSEAPVMEDIGAIFSTPDMPSADETPSMPDVASIEPIKPAMESVEKETPTMESIEPAKPTMSVVDQQLIRDMRNFNRDGYSDSYITGGENDPDVKNPDAVLDIEPPVTTEEEEESAEEKPNDTLDIPAPGSDNRNPAEQASEENEEEEEAADDAELSPLIAVEMDRSYDAKERARELAEVMLADKIEGDGSKLSRFTRRFRQRVWGNLFREAAKKKYERQALEAINEAQEIFDDPSLTEEQRRDALGNIYLGKSNRKLEASDWSVDSKAEAIKYSMVARESNEIYDAMIHTKAGENFTSYTVRRGEDGGLHVYEHTPGHGEVETRDEEKTRFAVTMREIVARYAKGEIADRQAFSDEILELRRDCPNESMAADFMTNNYFEIARTARERYDALAESADHEESLERVMRGFAVVNAETRSSVRTETHRNAIDKITDALSRRGVGRVIPLDVVAGAVGVASAIALGGSDPNSRGIAQRALRAMPPLSYALTGAIAGMKERGRTQEDITRMRRDAARGIDVAEGKRNEKLIDAVMTDDEVVHAESAAKTLHGLSEKLKAGELDSAGIDKLKSEYSKMFLARDLSDTMKTDFIRFSSADPGKIPEQRMHYDFTLAEAKTYMKNAGIDVEQLESNLTGGSNALHEFMDTSSNRDKIAAKLKRKMSLRAGAKAALTAGIVSVVGQEAKAFFDPSEIGLIERATGRAGNNIEGADETVLNSLWNRSGRFISTEGSLHDKVGAFLRKSPGGAGYDVYNNKTVETGVTRDRARELIEGNPDRTMRIAGQVGTGEYTETSLGDYVSGHSEQVHVSEWLNNGTAKVDLSETQVYFTGQDQWFAQLKNNPFNANMSVDPKAESLNGRLFWFIRTDDVDANNGMGFKIPAIMDPESGRITMDASDEVLKKVADGWDFSRIHLGVDMGLDDEGVRNIASIATTFGDGFDGSEIISRVENMVDVYDVTESTKEHIAGRAADALTRMTAGIAANRREELNYNSMPGLNTSFPDRGAEMPSRTTEQGPAERNPDEISISAPDDFVAEEAPSDSDTTSETPAPEAAEENAESPITPPISEETVETDYTVGGLSGAEAPDDFVAYEDGEPDGGESGEDDASSFEPITVDSAETMIPTMEESELIGRLTDNTGYEPPRFVYNNVLNAINKWNALNEAQRHELLSGTARNADLEYLLMANLIKLPSEVNEDMEMAA